MSGNSATLAEAEARSAAARERVATSFGRVQDKLNPKRVAHRAVREVTDVAATAAEVGVDTARRYPATIVGLTAAAGLFLARHRIADLVRTLTGRNR